MRVSGKKGDSVYTSVLRGERVSKNHPGIEAVGSLDEANSFLGLAGLLRKKSVSNEFYRSKNIYSTSALNSPFPKERANHSKRSFLKPI